MKNLKFIDLFCGTGAFSYVLEQNNCECVFSNDFGPLSEALIHGDRLGVLPATFGEEFVKKGQLIKLLPDYQVETPGPIYGVYPSKKYLSQKTQALLHFLEMKFSQL